MSFFSKIFHKDDLPAFTDNQIVSVADGQLLPLEEIGDATFSKELLGQTIALDISCGEIVSPANGKLEMIFPTGHAFGVRMASSQSIMVHIGIDTVDLKGVGFTAHAKQGDKVKAGQKIVTVDLQSIRQAGYKTTTMMIITDAPDPGKKENFLPVGTHVCRGQVINNK